MTGDQQYIKASAKYFAVGMAGGGGPVYVNRLDRPGRFDVADGPFVHGHEGAVNDFDWNPFDDSMMATGSEDTKIKIWQIPETWEPTDENGVQKAGEGLSESVVDLVGHRKKVTLLRFHPTAANTLMSSSGDYTVRIWDIDSGAEARKYGGCDNIIHDIVWDYTGDMFAVTCKDKKIRLVDPRAAETAAETMGHDGAKSVKLVYANDSGKLFSFGSSKQSTREIKVFDIKNFDKPIHTEPVDTAAGAMIPLWDGDTNVLYLCGKGDGIVRLYEYEDKSPFIFKLNDGFRSNIPGKGYCMVPKRGLKIMNCETARILKVTNNSGMHPLSFTVPRKSDAFQDDIFPDTAAAVPSHSFADWLEGSSKEPVKMSLNPKDGGKTAAAVSKPQKTFKPAAAVQKELEGAQKDLDEKTKSLETAHDDLDKSQKSLREANERIKYLEEKLKEAGIEY